MDESGRLVKQPNETSTMYWVRVLQHEAWHLGYVSGHSRAMRKMSDEPEVKDAVNPFGDEAFNV